MSNNISQCPCFRLSLITSVRQKGLIAYIEPYPVPFPIGSILALDSEDIRYKVFSLFCSSGWLLCSGVRPVCSGGLQGLLGKIFLTQKRQVHEEDALSFHLLLNIFLWKRNAWSCWSQEERTEDLREADPEPWRHRTTRLCEALFCKRNKPLPLKFLLVGYFVNLWPKASLII